MDRPVRMKRSESEGEGDVEDHVLAAPLHDDVADIGSNRATKVAAVRVMGRPLRDEQARAYCTVP